MDPAVDDVKTKLPKVAKVKNKMPAPVQITAEQLLREAKERELELVQPPPKQKISDPDELQAYRLRKRKMFEDNIRKNRSVMTNWIKYAQWEESQKEIQRARSVYERALDVDHRNITVWLKYAEMEMKCRQVNHARNVWDRAVTILPRANQFWYKYTYMEEMLKNIAGARQVFERWMEWEPDEQAWHSYINFELRYKELDRARAIYERFVITHPEVKNWIKYAKFEQKNGYINSARRIYERAVEFFGEDNMNEQILLAFAKFEESQKEHERARVIYKYALDHLGKDACQEVYKQYTIHEKKYGDRTAIEDVIVSKRKFQYEQAVKANPHDYDSWFDYLRLMECDGEVDQIREVYERAIANVPPSKVKRHWRRYIYLWIYYAVFEELVTEDYDRCEQVYQACLDLIPHKKFTFAKIWLLYAQFQIRQKNLGKARKILGTSIGKCPKDKLFRGYIDLEIQLREFERCRILYEKFLEFSPENCTTWMKFAELENILGDTERARAIFELAIAQPRLDMPEVLWKAYIDFEIEQEEYDRTRALYRRLLQRTQHVKVWISFAQFELSTGAEDAISKTRAIYREGNKALKSCEDKEERLMLLESWRQFEHEYGDEASQAAVHKMLPNKVKRRRKVKTEDGADAGWEEYFDYIFPDDEAAQPNLKLLAIAKKWKQKGDLDTITNDVNDSSSSESENENEEENEEQSGTKTLTNGNNVEQNLEKSDPGEGTGSGHNDVHRHGDTDSEGMESDSDSSSSSSSDNDKKSNDRKKKSTNNKSERRTRKRSSNSSSSSSSSSRSSSSNNSSDDNDKKSSRSSSSGSSSSESEGES